MIPIAGGILIAALILGAIYVGWSMAQVDRGAGWALMGIAVLIAVWVVF